MGGQLLGGTGAASGERSHGGTVEQHGFCTREVERSLAINEAFDPRFKARFAEID